MTWALFFGRWVVGLTFAMAGWWKVFALGPGEHARRFFVEGFAETWIPVALLQALGWSIPWLELVAGVLVCLGWRRREAYPALGGILVLVTYGHLLQEPLFDISGHIFTRLALLLFVLMVPANRDRWSLDEILARHRAT